MRRAVSNGLGTLIVFVGLVVAGNAHAQGKCQSLKFKAAGVAAKMKAMCYSRAAKVGTDVDPACLTKADEKLAKRWSVAEAAGSCVTTGDQTDAVGAIDQCLTAIGEVLDPPPPPTSLCCNLGTTCSHGLDAEGCTGFFGGTVGPEGSVCNGATGACEAPPAGTGRCCMSTSSSFCTSGPNLDLSGCVPPAFLDFIVGICTPSGACALP